MKRLKSLTLLIVLLFAYSNVVQASPNTITFQSRIVKPDGQPLEGSSVNFRITVTDTVGSCVIYQEDFNGRNMASSKGLINLSLGEGTKAYPVGPFTLREAFNNYGSPTFNCQAGGTINAGATDRRKMILQFNDGAGWQTVPAMDINATPFAMESINSHKLGSYPAGDFLRTATLPTCVGGEALHFNGTSIACVATGSGAPSYSSLAGATSTNTIDNTNYAQTWNWSTATTQNAMSVSANALTTGSLLNLTSSSATLNSTNGLLNVANTSASTTGTVARIQSNSTAGSGLTVLANGNVGIGTSSPANSLHIYKAQLGGTTALSIDNDAFNPGQTGGTALKFAYGNAGGGSIGGIYHMFDGSTYWFRLKAWDQVSFDEKERLTINGTTGNVGIGTTAPNRLLEVAGPVRISPTALPGSPAAGDIAVDSGDGNKLKIHDGSSWLTASSTANGTTNRIPKYTAANALGDSAITDDGSRITATRSIAAITNTVGAAAVNLNLSNTHTLAAVGGSTITITNPTDGGVYNIIVSDATSRTYTFAGCTASYFKPANAATTAASRTVYGLLTVYAGGGNWDCYITWSSGFAP